MGRTFDFELAGRHLSIRPMPVDEGWELWVMEGNTAARCFYEALGGREVARREQRRDGFSATGIAYAWDDVTVLA